MTKKSTAQMGTPPTDNTKPEKMQKGDSPTPARTSNTNSTSKKEERTLRKPQDGFVAGMVDIFENKVGVTEGNMTSKGLGCDGDLLGLGLTITIPTSSTFDSSSFSFGGIWS